MKHKILFIIIFLTNLIFIITAVFIQNKYYFKVNRIDYFIAFGDFSAVISLVCLFSKESPTFRKHLKNIILTICSILTVAVSISFFLLLPKYTIQDAYIIVSSDPRFQTGTITNYTSISPVRISDRYKNPLIEFAYTFLWQQTESTELIIFDPVDGAISLYDKTPIYGNGNVTEGEEELVFAQIAMGDHHTLGVQSDGKLWAWGSNYHGELGIGSTDDKPGPVFVMDDVIYADAGEDHSAAIKSDGSLWVWGRNDYGAIGDGTVGVDAYKTKPVKVLEDVIAVEAGCFVTMAVKSDGSLWAWGINSAGQLGNSEFGYDNCESKPIKVMEGVKAVCNNSSFSLIIKEDGSLWSCGYNSYEFKIGFYNMPEEEKKKLATPIKMMDDVQAVASGEYHVLALKTDHSLWAWGANGKGQLGDGTTNDSEVPIKVMDEVSKIAAGIESSMAIKIDESLWGWGSTRGGTLGINAWSGMGEPCPTPINILNNVENIAISQSNCIARKTDGNVWVWGSDGTGNLGKGINSDTEKPEKITYKPYRSK